MRVSSAFFTKFSKVISLVGSNREGERHVAADQAFRMCEENGLSILEALGGAFGNDSGVDELQKQIEELEDDNRKLAEAVNILNAQQQAVPVDAGRQLLARVWSYPQTRLLWALVMASGITWGLPELIAITNHLHRGWGKCWAWILIAGTALYVWEWAVAEYARRGLGVTLLKAPVVVAGISVATFVYQEDSTSCCVVLGCTAGLTLTNGAVWLTHRLAYSDDGLSATLRSWFK
jgi:hypothetical protein